MWGLDYQTCGVIATLIGIAAMTGVTLYALARRNRAIFAHAARLPLDEAEGADTRAGAATRERSSEEVQS